jgi:hypothetical protein
MDTVEELGIAATQETMNINASSITSSSQPVQHSESLKETNLAADDKGLVRQEKPRTPVLIIYQLLFGKVLLPDKEATITHWTLAYSSCLKSLWRVEKR